MEKYRCVICDYIYDPAEGDPGSGVDPGTSFDDLPADWVCPLCGAGKEDFEKMQWIKNSRENSPDSGNLSGLFF